MSTSYGVFALIELSDRSLGGSSDECQVPDPGPAGSTCTDSPVLPLQLRPTSGVLKPARRNLGQRRRREPSRQSYCNTKPWRDLSYATKQPQPWTLHGLLCTAVTCTKTELYNVIIVKDDFERCSGTLTEALSGRDVSGRWMRSPDPPGQFSGQFSGCLKLPPRPHHNYSNSQHSAAGQRQSDVHTRLCIFIIQNFRNLLNRPFSRTRLSF